MIVCLNFYLVVGPLICTDTMDGNSYLQHLLVKLSLSNLILCGNTRKIYHDKNAILRHRLKTTDYRHFLIINELNYFPMRKTLMLNCKIQMDNKVSLYTHLYYI